MEVYPFNSSKISLRILKKRKMKKNIQKFISTKKIVYLTTIFATLVLAIACEIPEDAGSVLEIRAETNIFSHKTFITINDIVDQNNLNGNVLKANITILDDNRPNLIVSEGGDFTNVIDLPDGIGALAVNPSYRGFSEPINILLEIYGNDYLTKKVSLTINPEDYTTQINESMMKITSTPDGVGVKLQEEALTGGSNASDISVSTDPSTEGTSSDVNIPAGNIFKDANGNPINSGDLSVEVVHFDGKDIDASRVSNTSDIGSLEDENGQVLTNVILAPLATADVNMFVGGVEVKEFNTPIQIVMDVNEDVINPNTGTNVAAGDEINIYSTSDDSNWAYLGKEIITDAGGKLVISFETNHLSTFSAAFKVEKCVDGKAILQLPNNGSGFASVYMGKFITLTGAVFPTVGIKIGDKLSLVNAPSENANLVLQPFFSDGLSVTIENIAWCSSSNDNPAEVSNINDLIPEGVTVNLNISAKCPSGNSAIIPNEVKVFIDYQGFGFFKDVGIIKDGKIALPGIVLNKSYEMKVTYDGESGFGNYTFTSENEDILDYDLPGEVCTSLNL